MGGKSLGARSSWAIFLSLAAVACHAAAPAEPQKVAQAVQVAAPTIADLTRTLLATGSVQAWQEVIIAPEVGGYQVSAVNVEIGDSVKRGQLLARLSSDLLESSAQIARASVMQANAALANAQAALDRGEMMASKGALAAADLDTLRANHIAAQAGVATAKANQGAADLRVRLTRVLAPDDGIITARTVNVGQVIQAGTEILRLLRKGRVEWRAEVPEADMRQVQAGQKVAITTVEGTNLAGTVRSVAPTVQSANRTGIVYVDIPGIAPVRPGMFARGEIALNHSAALLVPLASVLVQDGYSYVFVLRDDATVQRRRVHTGVVQASLIEIADGLTAAERVVASGVAFLTDGQKVTVRPSPSLP
jgi:HlyD family secretion protein